MYMGGQEMRKVLERDNITIKKNLEKVSKPTSVISGATTQYLITYDMIFKNILLELSD